MVNNHSSLYNEIRGSIYSETRGSVWSETEGSVKNETRGSITAKSPTLSELRSYKGFEKYTDEEAQATIKSLEKLSMLFYELYMKQKHSQSKTKQLKGGKHEGEEFSEQRDAA